MAVLLRASRARFRVPLRRVAPPVALPPLARGFSAEPKLVGRLRALAEGLLLLADYLDFIGSGAWLLPCAAELAAGALARAPLGTDAAR